MDTGLYSMDQLRQTPPGISETAKQNGMKIEPQVEGKKEFLCRNLVKIRPTVWALEGSKV